MKNPNSYPNLMEQLKITFRDHLLKPQKKPEINVIIMISVMN